MACLECGGPVPVKPANRHGPQPILCSKECAKRRKRKTHDAWVVAHEEQQRKYHAANRRKCKDTNPDYFKTHYAKNRERKKRQSLEWYRQNTQRHADRQKLYNAAHPDQIRATGRRASNKRRAITKNVFVEVVDPETVFDRDKGRCGICMKAVKKTSDWEIDHIIPISKGGAHSYDNVQLAHMKCNRSKSAKLPKGQPTLFQVIAV